MPKIKQKEKQPSVAEEKHAQICSRFPPNHPRSCAHPEREPQSTADVRMAGKCHHR